MKLLPCLLMLTLYSCAGVQFSVGYERDGQRIDMTFTRSGKQPVEAQK